MLFLTLSMDNTPWSSYRVLPFIALLVFSQFESGDFWCSGCVTCLSSFLYYRYEYGISYLVYRHSKTGVGERS